MKQDIQDKKGLYPSLSHTTFMLKELRNTLFPTLFGLFGIAFGLLLLAYNLSLQGKTLYIPYLVTVDTNGSILSSGVINSNSKVPDSAVAASLAMFVEDLYSRSGNLDLEIKKMTRNYAMTSDASQAREFLDNYYRTLDLKDMRVKTSKVKSIVRTSDNSFEVQFTSDDDSCYRVQMIYNLNDLAYRNLDELRLNPTGILINTFIVQKILS
ncbi:MAG: VirB8/TrbF family protein [Succinivibrio sp.]